MKTIVQTTIHSNSCERAGCSTCGQHHWQVSIAHRADGELVGGTVVAWLMQTGEFAMPRDAKEAGHIRRFAWHDEAAAEAKRVFSVLRYSAAEQEKMGL